jgi:hypothetical protein
MPHPAFAWEQDWDADIGLWWRAGPGHTAGVGALDRVHPGPDAAARLFYAAEIGAWDPARAGQVLAALARMQEGSGGPRAGCLRWYWEEPAVHDTNAAFFTGLGLIPLRLRHRALLSPPALDRLDDLLRGLAGWFRRAVDERSFCYPNRYLGDLVCAWLLAEIQGPRANDADLEATLLAAARYWRENGWGWGEHMSDAYAGVCLQELSLLLLLAERLPPAVRQTYEDLLHDLLRIEDQYGGLPRVPALRSYSFLASPPRLAYRARITAAGAGEPPALDNLAPLERLFHRLGWDRLAGPPAPAAADVRVPCFGGAAAVARLEPDCRLGSVTRFPVMPSAEAAEWGLAWQSFPVAFWRLAGDWGFLQWAADADGATRCHPAEDKRAGFLGNALTRAVNPPVVGRTYALQRGGDLLVLRLMTPLVAEWTRVADRFRLVNGRARCAAAMLAGNRAELRLEYPERTVNVQYLDLAGTGLPVLRPAAAGRQDFEVECAGVTLQARRNVVGLWAISLGGPIPAAPRIEPLEDQTRGHRHPEERAWTLHWEWPQTTWHVRIDPLAPEPLAV